MRFLAFIFSMLFIACGGGGSSTGPSPNPEPNPSPNPEPTPVVRDRSFTLEQLSVDAGPEPLVVRSPQVTGALDMRASGRYTMSFRLSVGNLVWEERVSGTHSFSSTTLRLVPDDSVKTSIEPFVQTVIVENANVPWIGESRVVISLPIRPGGFRAEDRIELSYVAGTQVTSGLTQPIQGQLLQVVRDFVSRE